MVDDITELVTELRGLADRVLPPSMRAASIEVRAADALEALSAEGLCWDDSPVPPVPKGVCAPLPNKCELRAGHKGAHTSGRMTWQTRDPYNTVLARAEAAEVRADTAEAAIREALAVLDWMPGHDGSDPYLVGSDYYQRAQAADEALRILSAVLEQTPNEQAPS